MVLRWSDALPFLFVLVVEAAMVAPLAAQRVRELGVQAVATAAEESAVVVGPVAGVRVSSRARVSLGGGVGLSEEVFAWRAELLGHFLLNPMKRRGPGVYGAAGVAAVGGPFERGYMVLLVGIENRPGTKSGWMAEAGVGGGARLAVGYRWRWLPKGWRFRD